VSHCTRTTSLAFASALAWTAFAADPAGSPSQTCSTSSTSPGKPPVEADNPSGKAGGHFGTVANHTANAVFGITAKWEF